MPIQIEIDIPIPSGYQPIAYRLPKRKEYYINQKGTVSTCTNCPTKRPRVILIKEWEAPKGILKPGWIAMDIVGTWWWFPDKPIEENDEEWLNPKWAIWTNVINMDFPYIDKEQWKDSVRQIKGGK